MVASAGPGVRAGPTSFLPVVDAAVLVAFTLVGVSTHDHGLPPAALARVGLPLLAAWFLAALAVGTYRVPGLRTLLAAWIVAVPVAAFVRTVLAGGPWGGAFLLFVAVAMAFTLVFLGAGRALVAVVRRREPD